MSSEISLPRKIFSSNNTNLYKSLGSLIKEYRKWRDISQEKFAELIRISVRELQNWEANRRRVRIENLHDIAELTGIPMQVLVVLNAGQPIWYSLRKRLFMYSLIEKAHCSSYNLFSFNENPEHHALLKTVAIKTEKQINMILSCHSDLYGTKKSLRKEVIKAAIKIIPDMNIIIYDYWGHYVGHRITLPFKMDIYQALKTQNTIEDFLTVEMISDIIALGEGVFFNYSTFVANLNSSSWLANATQAISKIRRKEGYVLASHTVTKETETILKNLNMTFVRDYPHLHDEVCPVIYETKLDYQLRPDGPFGWMVESTAEKAAAENMIREAQQKPQPATFVQDTDQLSHPEASPAKKSEHKVPVMVDKFPSIVDRKRPVKQYEKPQYIKSKIEVCTNPKCSLYAKTGKGNIVSNGTYQTKEGTPGRRFLCKECSKSFCSRTETIFYDLRSSEEIVLKALKLLVKGMPQLRVAKSLGVKFDTIRHWLEVAAQQRGKIDAMLINEPDISHNDLKVFWTFVKIKSLRQRTLLCRVTNKTYITKQER